jgi:hypothetical protein
MGLAHLRYVSFSYGAHLTHRDNGKMMRLVTSPRYRDLWGDRFAMLKVGEQKIENDQTGWKFATSRSAHLAQLRHDPARWAAKELSQEVYWTAEPASHRGLAAPAGKPAQRAPTLEGMPIPVGGCNKWLRDRRYHSRL